MSHNHHDGLLWMLLWSYGAVVMCRGTTEEDPEYWISYPIKEAYCPISEDDWCDEGYRDLFEAEPCALEPQ